MLEAPLLSNTYLLPIPHQPEATVHEALLFSARLRLPASVPAATAERFVEEVRALSCSWAPGGRQPGRWTDLQLVRSYLSAPPAFICSTPRVMCAAGRASCRAPLHPLTCLLAHT